MTAERKVTGCCPLDCQDGCSWVAHVVDGKVVRVEGAKEHPFTRGTLCAKVNDYEKRTYAPDRLLYPHKRVGAKGEGRFERISWDDAIDTIAVRFGEILERHGAESLLAMHYAGSMGVLQRQALHRLFNLIGATRVRGSICGASANELAREGHPRGFDPEDIAESRFILLWGANLLTTSHHQFHFIQEAQRRHGTRVVCIDPRRTITAKACDEYLAIRPGSDTVLAAALAQVLLSEGLADLEFASQVASDLDALRTQVAEWTPERASEICGIAADDIRRIAREFGAARPATIRTGIAPQQSVHGDAFVRAISALAMLGGHWKHKGGGVFTETSPNYRDAAAARPDLGPQGARRVDMARLGEDLTNPALDPPIHGFMVWTMNPATVLPDAARVRAGLAREDLFTVVIENFLTDTARYADILLPSTTQLEHFDLQGSWGHHYLAVNEPAIEPLGESKSHTQMLHLLAARMGLDHPALFESEQQIAAACLPAGVTLDDVRRQGWLKSSPPPFDFAAMPAPLRIAGGVPQPLTPPDGAPLQLLTPKPHFFLNSSFVNMPRQRRAMGRPTLEMNERDADARGLAEEQAVLVRNERGALRAWLQRSDAIAPGVVSLVGKWWSEPAETAALGNLLTPSSWAPSGQPAYNDTFVDVVAAPDASST